MLKNHFKIAWRQLLKNRLVSGINIFGLGLGLTVGIFILLYVKHEISYDTWIPDHENIYRVYRPYANGTKGNLTTPGPVANAMREEIPGIVSTTRYIGWGDKIVEWKKVNYSIKNVVGVDSTFFQTIPLHLKYGSPQTASRKNNLAIITDAVAQRIFGNMNPVGENILLDNADIIEVAGVLAAPEAPTHLTMDMYVVSTDRDEGYWTGGFGQSYVRLSPNTKVESVTASLFEIAKKKIIREDLEDGEITDESTLPQWALQPMSDIHLKSQHLGRSGTNSGSPWQIGMMIIIGSLVLLIAAINYINLSTAQMSTRAKEVSIRNVAGATRQQLVGQFLSEALLTTFFALLIALFLSNLLLPYFNEMMSREIPFQSLLSGWTLPLILGLTLVTGLTTGIFPAFYLSKINPSESLKSKFFRDNRSSTYRNALIVSQFTLSIGSVLFVTMVWQQVNYMMEKDLGFNKNQIALFRINSDELSDNFQSKKELFLSIPGVESVSQVSRAPGGRISNYGMNIEGKEIKPYVNILFGDTEWNKTFQIPLKEGRFLSRDISTDTAAFVVNETFVKKYGIENPIGQRIKFSYDDNYSTIVGVVEDFHYNGLQSKILPVAICSNATHAWMGSVAVRFESDKLSSSLAAVSTEWKKLEPVFPVTYSFLDEDFNKQYKSYMDFGRNMTYATFICFFLALIGLFGLTVFILQRKTKEIGIRKVLGASTAHIVGLLSKDFIKLVMIAFLIAAPVAWYFADDWLQNFAYRLDVQWWVFLMVGVLAILTTFITVSLRTLGAAMANPVESIKVE